MRIRTTLALTVTTLTLGVPVATAAPDGYQPDAVDRYLATVGEAGEPDAVARYLRNHPNGPGFSIGSTGASSHPDSLAVRAGASIPANTVEGESFSWTGVAFGTIGGALIVLLAVAGASAMRERRRLVLR
jgi:hypothetical protein